MAITKISELTSAIRTGARSNLFRVSFPDFKDTEFAGVVEQFSFLCKGAQLPGSTLGLIEVPFQAGRRFKLAGDRTFPEWTTTIINDANQTVRAALEALQRQYGLTDYETTSSKILTGASETEFTTLQVEQFDQAGLVSCTYQLINCWPTDISTLDLSYDSTDTIEEFTVTWAYDYYTTVFRNETATTVTGGNE
jgi:hypothetical protein